MASRTIARKAATKAKGKVAKKKPARAAAKKAASKPKRTLKKASARKTPDRKKSYAKKAPTSAKKSAPAGKAKPVAKKRAAAKPKAPKSTAKSTKAAAKRPAARPSASKAGKAVASSKPRAGKAKRAPSKQDEAERVKESKIAAAERARLADEERRKRAQLHTRARVPKNYEPSEKEPFMNPKQLGYFKNKLLDWRAELLRESNQTLAHLQESSLSEPDLADRASAESDRSLELRTRDRERKLISKIDSALGRIVDGSYGYCEETDEPIGLKRLEARPIATLSIEAQERHERRERVYRDE